MAEIKLKIASVVIGSGEGGGSGVAPYYADLPDKPRINGKTLSGNKTSKDLGLASSEQVVPSGGTTGQVLTKKSNLPNDVEWAPSSGIIGANANNLDAGSEATASIDENHILQLGIPVGRNAVNPFKGWFTTDNIPTTGQEGDYCYITDNGVTNVYKWNGTIFEQTTDVPDTDHTQSFASNESVNQVAIDDSHLVNPTNSFDSTKPVLANAQDVMGLKIKIGDINAKEDRLLSYTSESGRYGSSGYAGANANATRTEIEIPANTEYIRFLGLICSSDAPDTVKLMGGSMGHYDEGSWVNDFGFVFDEAASYGTKEYLFSNPPASTHFRITCSYGTTFPVGSFYCYFGSGENISEMIYALNMSRFERDVDLSDTLQDVVKINHSISTQNGLVIEDGQHIVLPLTGGDKSVTICANDNSFAIVSFLSEKDLIVGSMPEYASCFDGVVTIDEGTEKRFAIPPKANYLYLSTGINGERIPEKMVISKQSLTPFKGIPIVPFDTLNEIYINDSFEEVSNNNYNVLSFNIRDISVIGFVGRLANSSANPFYDENDNVITFFKSKYSTDSKEYDFNDVVVVPAGAVYLKLSVAKNMGFSVFDCSNSVDKDAPRNVLSGKKVSFLGDSITYGWGLAGDRHERYSTVFCRDLARCVENNQGVAGSCLASNTKNRQGQPSDRFMTRAGELGGSDVIFIWGGTNDFSYDIKPIGQLFVEQTISENTYRGTKQLAANPDNETFAGALHELLSYIRTTYPSSKVVFLNIMNRGIYGGWDIDRPTSFQCNANGDYLGDFNEAIEKICSFYAIPVVDIASLINQNWAYDNGNTPAVLQSMDLDGIHPNAAGHRRIAKILFNYVINNRLV